MTGEDIVVIIVFDVAFILRSLESGATDTIFVTFHDREDSVLLLADVVQKIYYVNLFSIIAKNRC
jgi:hypothetical protein